jgi:hypothetical protein
MLTLATGIRLVQGRFVLSTDAKQTVTGLPAMLLWTDWDGVVVDLHDDCFAQVNQPLDEYLTPPGRITKATAVQAPINRAPGRIACRQLVTRSTEEILIGVL